MDADAGRRLTGHPKIPDGAPPGVIDLSRPSLLDWAEAVLPDSSVPDGNKEIKKMKIRTIWYLNILIG
jgi:hypothetical protein